ncbi:STAS domain-containing protein, partial [Streptomyces sp. NPDC059134]|uniref:STAS domain-containing protein n=1 Tax=Streptomyces sp. NPDC059134 TaxID=3346738 RepID=UPI00369AF918
PCHSYGRAGGRARPGGAAPRLRAELGARLRGSEGAGGVVCDVGGLRRPNLAAVHVLVALQLDARRRGRPLRLRGVGSELRLLLDLVGLAGRDGEPLVLGDAGDAGDIGGIGGKPDGRGREARE